MGQSYKNKLSFFNFSTMNSLLEFSSFAYTQRSCAFCFLVCGEMSPRFNILSNDLMIDWLALILVFSSDIICKILFKIISVRNHFRSKYYSSDLVMKRFLLSLKRRICWMRELYRISLQVFAFLSTGVLVVLDARPDGIIYKDLIPEYVHIARTLYEG